MFALSVYYFSYLYRDSSFLDREQRVTALLVGILSGVAVLMTGVLRVSENNNYQVCGKEKRIKMILSNYLCFEAKKKLIADDVFIQS